VVERKPWSDCDICPLPHEDLATIATELKNFNHLRVKSLRPGAHSAQCPQGLIQASADRQVVVKVEQRSRSEAAGHSKGLDPGIYARPVVPRVSASRKRRRLSTTLNNRQTLVTVLRLCATVSRRARPAGTSSHPNLSVTVLQRVHRSNLLCSLVASALSGATLLSSPVAAQPAPEPPAAAPTAPPPVTPAPDTSAPTVTPAPPAAAPAAPAVPAAATTPPPADEKKPKKSKKNKDEDKLGAGDPRTEDDKFPQIGGAKGPVLAADSKDENKYGEIEIHGRLFTRATLSTREAPRTGVTGPQVRINALDLSVPSARIGFDYQSPLKWLSAQMEAELTDRTPIKDGWVRARKRFVTVKGGNFKVPISALALESAVSLPLVDRGLIHDLLLDVFQVGDRRMGVSVELHDRDATAGLRPTLTLAAFQGSTLDQGIYRDIEDETLRGQSYAARVELKPGDFTFGFSFEHRVGPEVVLVVPEGGTPELRRPSTCEEACSSHYYTFGADAALDVEFETTGLRFWLDGLAGRSWMESARKRLDPERSLDGAFPIFGSLRALLAYRFGGISRRDFYVEPYGMAGVLDPDLAYGRDHVAEWVLGVNVGRWKLARVGLEGQVHRGAARLPAGLGGDPDRLTLMLQGAVAF
jgi:hypothetical protein